MIANKRREPGVDESFVHGRKVTISLVFIAQSHFAAQKMSHLHLSLI